MPVQITINGENANQAIEEFAALSAVFVGQAPAATLVKEEAKPRQQRKAATETKKDDPKEEPVQDTASNEETENDPRSEEEEIPSVVDLRAKAQEVGKDAKKKPAIKELLGKFESASISDVPEEKRVAFMAELEAL